MIDDPEAGLRNREIAHPDGTSAGSATTKMRAKEKDTGEKEPQNVINVNTGGH
jgi:hypothetical protein